MKKVITCIAVCVVILAAIVGGIELYRTNSRPDLNGNEQIVSTALEADGTPKDELGNTKGITVSKDEGKVYLSIPVNSKKMDSCHVRLLFEKTELDDTNVSISDARYATYCFDNLENRDSGLYQFEFYDSENQLNVIASINLE